MSVLFNWEKKDFEKLISNCPKEPVTPYIFKYFSKKDLLLEAGCGSGRFVYYLDDLGYKIKGIELNQKMVEIINQEYPALDIEVADVTSLPFRSESLDGIISLEVIEHVYEGLKESIYEMHRVLKDDSYAIVIVPSFNLIRRIKLYLGIYHFRAMLSLIKKLVKKNTTPVQKKIRVGRRFNVLRWPVFGGFFEYKFSKKEFERQLDQGGFSIIESIPVSLIDGIHIEFGKWFAPLNNYEFSPNYIGKKLNKLLSKKPFLHNHMHLCVIKKQRRAKKL